MVDGLCLLRRGLKPEIRTDLVGYESIYHKLESFFTKVDDFSNKKTYFCGYESNQ